MTSFCHSRQKFEYFSWWMWSTFTVRIIVIVIFFLNKKKQTNMYDKFVFLVYFVVFLISKHLFCSTLSHFQVMFSSKKWVIYNFFFVLRRKHDDWILGNTKLLYLQMKVEICVTHENCYILRACVFSVLCMSS